MGTIWSSRSAVIGTPQDPTRGIFEANQDTLTNISQNCQQTGVKKKTKRGKVDKNKVKRALSNDPDDESEPETFQCEYCLTPGHTSVIECEKCNKWGCPECTHLPPDVHKILGKWGNLHWYCSRCEPAITMFCKSESIHFDKTEKPDNIGARVSRPEDMIIILEERIDKVIAQNEQVIKSYVQVVKDAAEGTFLTVTPQPITRITPAERSTVKLFDENADLERRKNKLIIHNIPEIEVQDLPGRNRDDIQSIQNLIEKGLNIDGVEITKAIGLGGRGQNKGTKPGLILATLDTPATKK